MMADTETTETKLIPEFHRVKNPHDITNNEADELESCSLHC